MNRKGEVVIGLVVLTLIFGIVGSGFYKTYKNGVLQNNGKKILCKVLNKGADHCDAQYPNPQ